MKSSGALLRRVALQHILTFVLCFALLFAAVEIGTNRVSAQDQPVVKPAHISMQRLGIDLPIAESGYNSQSGEWEISNTQAHYANTTSPLNAKSGATLVYAHNTSTLFGKLSGLQAGDSITITGSDNHTYTYSYQSDELVTPSNGSIFSYRGPYQLVLLDCYGPHSELRRLMYFKRSN